MKWFDSSQSFQHLFHLLIFSVFCRPKLGFFVEIFGFINLFGNFIPHLIVVAKHMPVIGKVLELPGFKQVYVLSGNTFSTIS